MDSVFNVKYYKINISRTKSNSFFKTKLPESTHNIFSNPLLDIATKREIQRDNLVKEFFLKSLGKNSKIRNFILTNNKVSNHPFQQLVLNQNNKERKNKKIDKELSFRFSSINFNHPISRSSSLCHFDSYKRNNNDSFKSPMSSKHSTIDASSKTPQIKLLRRINYKLKGTH